MTTKEQWTKEPQKKPENNEKNCRSIITFNANGLNFASKDKE
jgi:hypothetical protein